jgi:cysteine desulfurase
MKKRIYLDYASTTPLSKAAFSAMKEYFFKDFGNADSVHSFGGRAALGLDSARRAVADAIGADKDELFFTSGGTEANNFAVIGTAKAQMKKSGKNHIIVSAIEHASVISAAASLIDEGFTVTKLGVSKDGIVSAEDLEKAITKKTAVISVMTANNEIGSIQPIKELSGVSEKYGIPFHTDAVQAVGTLNVSVKDLGAEFLSISAHKFFGPKGIGALYVKKGCRLRPLIVGGQQEREKRGGTSNVAGAAGMAAALSEAIGELRENYDKIKSLRDYFVSRVEAEIPAARYNGSKTDRLPQNANFSFSGLAAGELIHVLDLAGVCVSSGSACSSGSQEPSHVLSALGVTKKEAQSAIRFSLSKLTTSADIDFTVETLKKVLSRLSNR